MAIVMILHFIINIFIFHVFKKKGHLTRKAPQNFNFKYYRGKTSRWLGSAPRELEYKA